MAWNWRQAFRPQLLAALMIGALMPQLVSLGHWELPSGIGIAAVAHTSLHAGHHLHDVAGHSPHGSGSFASCAQSPVSAMAQAGHLRDIAAWIGLGAIAVVVVMLSRRHRMQPGKAPDAPPPRCPYAISA